MNIARQFMKTVISASRRTDIPAFYMDWFMQGVHNGFFEVQNPYNQKRFVVPASTADVHTIVFWSKNFGPFITGDYGRQLWGLNTVLPVLWTSTRKLQDG